MIPTYSPQLSYEFSIKYHIINHYSPVLVFGEMDTSKANLIYIFN